MKWIAAAVLLAAAAIGAKLRLDQARGLLSGHVHEVRKAHGPAVEALRQRALILPELERGASAATGESLRAAVKAMTDANSQDGLIAASSAIDDAVARWLVEAEESDRRPGLEALEERLRETEVRFAQARAKYNAAVQRYNIALELFPNNVAARIDGLRRDDSYFVTELAPRRR